MSPRAGGCTAFRSHSNGNMLTHPARACREAWFDYFRVMGFGPDRSALYCNGCDAGSYRSAGAITCSTCGAGQYSAANASACTLCPEGTYMERPGAASCMPCPTDPNAVVTSPIGSLSRDYCTHVRRVVGYTSFEEPETTGGATVRVYRDVATPPIAPHELSNYPNQNPVAYAACSNYNASVGGPIELGFRAFYEPHGLTSGFGLTGGAKIGVIGDAGTSQRGDLNGGGFAPDGTQYYELEDTNGFVFIAIDPVTVREYSNVQMRAWIHVESTTWEPRDYIKVWASDADEEADVVLLEGTDLDTQAAVTTGHVVENTWTEYVSPLYGFTAVSMNFGLLADSNTEEVWFDFFRVLGFGAEPITTCADCISPGTQRTHGMVECQPCAAGKYDHDNASATACRLCAPGSFAAAGHVSCEACAPGSFAAEGGTSSADCMQCAAGQFDADGAASTPCQPCPPGTYSSDRAATSCDGSCAAGTFAPAGSTTVAACVQCVAGQYDQDLSGTTPCLDCPAGQFSARSGSTECSACETGRFAPAASQSCGACLPGQSDTDQDASTPCSACPVGTFTGTASGTGCAQCPPGTSTAASGGVTIGDCLRQGCTDEGSSSWDPAAIVADLTCRYDCSRLTLVSSLPAGAQCYIYRPPQDGFGGWPESWFVDTEFGSRTIMPPAQSTPWVVQGNSMAGATLGSRLAVVNSAVVLRGIRIVNESVSESERNGGAILVHSSPRATMSTLTVVLSLIDNNQASNSGGGVYMNSGSELSTINTTFLANTATHRGGGMHLETDAVVSVAFSTFDSNEASDGGAVFMSYNVTLHAQNVTFVRNVAHQNGAGVYVSEGAIFTVLGGTFSENVALGDTSAGAGIWADSAQTIELSGCVFDSNVASGGGGGAGVYARGGVLHISGSTFVRNTVAGGLSADLYVLAPNYLSVFGSAFWGAADGGVQVVAGTVVETDLPSLQAQSGQAPAASEGGASPIATPPYTPAAPPSRPPPPPTPLRTGGGSPDPISPSSVPAAVTPAPAPGTGPPEAETLFEGVRDADGNSFDIGLTYKQLSIVFGIGCAVGCFLIFTLCKGRICRRGKTGDSSAAIKSLEMSMYNTKPSSGGLMDDEAF